MLSRPITLSYESPIAIVGGGLVGPFTEIMLRKSGFENVTTYEASPVTRKARGGILGIDKTVYEALDEASIPLDEVVASSANRVMLYELKDNRVVSGSHATGFDGINTTWNLFNAAVAQRTDIRYQKRVTSVGEDFDGVGIDFSDGTSTTAELAIFTDGRNSQGRKMFDPERRPVYQDYMVWRGMGDPNVLDKAPEVFTRFQDSTAGCLMTVSEPITQGDDKGKVDWALFQNMPATDFIELFGAMPENKPYIFPHQVTPDAREALHKHAKGFLPHDLVELVTSTGDVTAVPMNDVAVPQSCIKEVGVGHVALVGDALMPVRPHTARGLNNGLQQAANLPGVLRSPELDFVQEWEEATVRSLAHWAMIGQDRAQQFGLGQC